LWLAAVEIVFAKCLIQDEIVIAFRAKIRVACGNDRFTVRIFNKRIGLHRPSGITPGALIRVGPRNGVGRIEAKFFTVGIEIVGETFEHTSCCLHSIGRIRLTTILVKLSLRQIDSVPTLTRFAIVAFRDTVLAPFVLLATEGVCRIASRYDRTLRKLVCTYFATIIVALRDSHGAAHTT
jgi:hypothetical protein